MQDAWFIFLIVLGMLIFGGALFGFWAVQAVAKQREKRTLTATDLRLLEETVESLIERLKAASDEAVTELDRRQQQLQSLLDRVDARLQETPLEEPDLTEIRRLAGQGFDEPEIARRSGLTRGEIELMLQLGESR